jgi:hypothetical protein
LSFISRLAFISFHWLLTLRHYFSVHYYYYWFRHFLHYWADIDTLHFIIIDSYIAIDDWHYWLISYAITPDIIFITLSHYWHYCRHWLLIISIIFIIWFSFDYAITLLILIIDWLFHYWLITPSFLFWYSLIFIDFSIIDWCFRHYYFSLILRIISPFSFHWFSLADWDYFRLLDWH